MRFRARSDGNTESVDGAQIRALAHRSRTGACGRSAFEVIFPLVAWISWLPNRVLAEVLVRNGVWRPSGRTPRAGGLQTNVRCFDPIPIRDGDPRPC